MPWTYVMDAASLPDGSMAPVYPRGVNIVVARVRDEFYAVEGKCAHMACPLFMGTLEGYTLICPCHDWRYDIRTGRFRAAPELALATYAIKADAGKLYVDMP